MAKSGFAAATLKSFVNRIVRLEEEKQALADDIKEVYNEAKGSGFDTRVIRKRVIPLIKQESADRDEQDAMEDLYRSAVGIARK
jgi:uncharacterized protein (UPF0335 family)